MRNLAIALLLSVQGLCAAAEPNELGDVVGLWQFPDRGVWVLVNRDGSAFQCRHAPSGTLFTSKGKIVAPHAIEWQDIWGTDQYTLVEGALTLSGKWGVYSYRKAKGPMYEGCVAAER